MRLYKISESTNLKITGDFPQSQKMIKGYDYDAPNSSYILYENRNKEINFTPNLDSFLLQKEANKTDVISATPLGGMGFMVSDKLKDLLTKFNLIDHKYFKASFVHGEKKYNDYQRLHFISKLYKKVEFKSSDFIISGGKEIDFNNFSDLNLKSKELGVNGEIYAKRLCFKSNILKNLDLFFIGFFDFNTYISENLKNEIELNNITGLNIVEVVVEVSNGLIIIDV
ncbi:hypothetical protein [Algibacter sp. 2305UL17-15]|uniref:hypothetical protein n=1 Tax=Algibacter sp. 2305UL17-15 TaxID=3231268 RepID=UPI003458BFBC